MRSSNYYKCCSLSHDVKLEVSTDKNSTIVRAYSVDGNNNVTQADTRTTFVEDLSSIGTFIPIDSTNAWLVGCSSNELIAQKITYNGIGNSLTKGSKIILTDTIKASNNIEAFKLDGGRYLLCVIGDYSTSRSQGASYICYVTCNSTSISVSDITYIGRGSGTALLRHEQIMLKNNKLVCILNGGSNESYYSDLLMIDILSTPVSIKTLDVSKYYTTSTGSPSTFLCNDGTIILYKQGSTVVEKIEEVDGTLKITGSYTLDSKVKTLYDICDYNENNSILLYRSNDFTDSNLILSTINITSDKINIINSCIVSTSTINYIANMCPLPSDNYSYCIWRMYNTANSYCIFLNDVDNILKRWVKTSVNTIDGVSNSGISLSKSGTAYFLT